MHPILEIQSTPFFEAPRAVPKEESPAPKGDFFALVRDLAKESEEVEKDELVVEEADFEEEVDLGDAELLVEEFGEEGEVDTVPVPYSWEKNLESEEPQVLHEQEDLILFPEQKGKEPATETLVPEEKAVFELGEVLPSQEETAESVERVILPSELVLENADEEIDVKSNQSPEIQREAVELGQDSREVPVEVLSTILPAQLEDEPLEFDSLEMEGEERKEELIPDPKGFKNTKPNSKNTQSVGELKSQETTSESKEERTAPKTSIELLSDWKGKAREETHGKDSEKPKKPEIQIQNLTPKVPSSETQVDAKPVSPERENPMLVQWSGQKLNAKSPDQVKAMGTSREAREAFQKNLNEIVKTARFQIVENGKSTARIELTPRELGKMTLHVTMDKDRVEGRITVETEFARAAVSSELSNLRMELKQAGLELDYLSIDMNQKEETFFSREERDRDSSREGKAGNSEDSDRNSEEEVPVISRKLLDIRI